MTFFRIGTSGGIGKIFNFNKYFYYTYNKFWKGIEPGTVVITEEALDGIFRPQYQQVNFNLSYQSLLQLTFIII